MKSFAALFFLVGTSALAQSIAEIDRLPIVDEVQILSASEIQKLQGLLESLKARARVSMGIFIAQSLKGSTIEDFSIRAAEKWKLGEKKVDRGLLLIVAPHERQLRLEVGYGLEGTIPDLMAKRILDEYVTPYFREAQFFNGLAAAIYRVAEIEGQTLEGARLPPRRAKASANPPRTILIILAFIIIVVLRSLSASNRRVWRGGRRPGSDDFWGGGGFPTGRGGIFSGGGGGGFGGFSGGGGFGGGGASSRW